MGNTRLHCSEHGDELIIGSEAYVVADCGLPSRGQFLVCARAVNAIPEYQRPTYIDTHSINVPIDLYEAVIRKPTFDLGTRLFCMTPAMVRKFLPKTAQLLLD